MAAKYNIQVGAVVDEIDDYINVVGVRTVSSKVSKLLISYASLQAVPQEMAKRMQAQARAQEGGQMAGDDRAGAGVLA